MTAAKLRSLEQYRQQRADLRSKEWWHEFKLAWAKGLVVAVVIVGAIQFFFR